MAVAAGAEAEAEAEGAMRDMLHAAMLQVGGDDFAAQVNTRKGKLRCVCPSPCWGLPAGTDTRTRAVMRMSTNTNMYTNMYTNVECGKGGDYES